MTNPRVRAAWPDPHSGRAGGGEGAFYGGVVYAKTLIPGPNPVPALITSQAVSGS